LGVGEEWCEGKRQLEERMEFHCAFWWGCSGG
jgi:hypothetical protein